MPPSLNLPPALVQALGWTLIHFLWQAAALALLFYVVLVFCRTALARYTAALVTLVLMSLCPLATFAVLEQRPPSALGSAPTLTQAAPTSAVSLAAPVPAMPPAHSAVYWLNWCVAIWLLGVAVLAVRALGGWLLVERLRHQKLEPLAQALLSRCLALQQRARVFQTVRYFPSRLVHSPAVIGWFRPVVLLPFAALTGLSPQQLDAIIVHELAHIRRFDSFVNLFQIIVETLLFYHPAVWWVSRCMRSERENCCDDIAVSVCGDVTEYARALAVIETWRATPALAMAANGAPLKTRIARLIGFDTLTRTSIPRAGLVAIGVLCAAGALFAGVSWRETFSAQRESAVPPAPAPPAAPAPPSTPDVAENAPPPPAPNPPEPPQAPSAAPPAPDESAPSGGSYIEDLHSAGLKDFTVDQLIALKIQGVTPEYVRRIHDAGLHPTIDQFIAMRIHRVTLEYIHVLESAGFAHLTVDQYIAAKIHGITPEFIQKIQSHGLANLTFDQLLALKFAHVL